MLKVLTPKEEIDTYHQSPFVSQSSLKLFLDETLSKPLRKNGIEDVEKELYFEEPEHFVIGNAVDTIVTNGITEYENKYIVVPNPIQPTEKIKSIVRFKSIDQ